MKTFSLLISKIRDNEIDFSERVYREVFLKHYILLNLNLHVRSLKQLVARKDDLKLIRTYAVER